MIKKYLISSKYHSFCTYIVYIRKKVRRNAKEYLLAIDG